MKDSSSYGSRWPHDGHIQAQKPPLNKSLSSQMGSQPRRLPTPAKKHQNKNKKLIKIYSSERVFLALS